MCHVPPQFSRLKRLLKLWLTNGAIFLRSCVLTRVANRDWWASLKVVSISRRPWCCRIARAKPSGPSFNRTSRKPMGGSPGRKKKNISVCNTHSQSHLTNSKHLDKSRGLLGVYKNYQIYHLNILWDLVDNKNNK